MKNLFRPITREVALADLAALPHRLAARTEHSYLYPQAAKNLRWYQLFITMNRRVAP